MWSTFRALSSSSSPSSSPSSSSSAASNAARNRAQYEAAIRKRRPNMLLKAGLPMVLLIVGGSLFLSNFVDTQVEMKDMRNKGTSERQFDLEEEHRKLLKKLDIDNFSLSRIPRPEELLEEEKKKKAQADKK